MVNYEEESEQEVDPVCPEPGVVGDSLDTRFADERLALEAARVNKDGVNLSIDLLSTTIEISVS